MFQILIFAFLILTIKASCPNESLEWQNECYFFKNDTSEFMTAELECVQIGGHLVSIHDAIVNALLAQEGGKAFSQSAVTDFWIGLTNLMPGGNWSWMDGTPLDFNDWPKEEPKNITGNNCATLSITDGFWRSDNCYKTKPYVCKVDKSFYDPTTPPPSTATKTTTTTGYPIYADCPFPFTYFQPTHSCYGVGNYTGPLNWEAGEAYCIAFGGHLTSIHSSQEMLFLGSYVYTGHNGYWTGAFSNDGGISWEWSDRTPWDFNPWTNGYPQLHESACGTLWGPAIGDRNCSLSQQIICKKSL